MGSDNHKHYRDPGQNTNKGKYGKQTGSNLRNVNQYFFFMENGCSQATK